MKLILTFFFLFTLCLPALSAPSPTGRTPKLLWTPERQDIWARMRVENHPWWILAKNNADRTGTSGQRYGDFGQWATFLYQVTGDRVYANKALVALRKEFVNTVKKDGNFTREYGAEYALLYDWLYPAMTSSDRSAFIAMLNRWADNATANASNPAAPIRTADSDQTVGNFFQFAFLALATTPNNPRASEFLNRSYVGGLTATGINRTTLRNTIKQYVVELAEGGQWMEGAQYNMGTLKLLLMGAEGVRTASGIDHFPEVTSLLPKLGLGQVYEVTGDLRASFQWGDEEHPRDLSLTKRVGVLGMLGGLLQNDASSGPYVNFLVEAFAKKYGYTGYQSAEPHSRLLYFYNPYARTADYRSLPSHFYAPGQGVHLFRDGWETADSLLGIHIPKQQVFVDHQVNYFGDFQLYRRGEWAITHPLGYGGPPNNGEGTNTMLLAGLSSMEEQKRTIAVESDPKGRYLYTAGTNSGQKYQLPYYQPPRPFVDEWTRSFLYIPSPAKTHQFLVIFDRVKARAVLDLARYRKADQDLIRGALARKQWIIHAPVVPTLTPEALLWKTPGGQQVRVETLLPVAQRRVTINEDAVWSDGYPYPVKSEQKFAVRIMPDSDQDWDTFLNVVQVYDQVPATVTRVTAVTGEAQGALIQQEGQPDRLVLFGALSAARVLTGGYLVRWKARADQTEVFLADLDPGGVWKARLDEGCVVDLPISSQGLARLTVKGAGDRSVRLEVP